MKIETLLRRIEKSNKVELVQTFTQTRPHGWTDRKYECSYFILDCILYNDNRGDEIIIKAHFIDKETGSKHKCYDAYGMNNANYIFPMH